MRVPLADFIEGLSREQPRSVLSDGSPIPDQVRYIHTRGDATLAVIELSPQVRRVRWISADSKMPFDEGTQYESVNLAFPFIVLLILFRKGNLCNYQQLFYRTRPLRSEKEKLYFPNLLNVAPAYGYISCFCVRKIGNISALPMGYQIQKLIQHFWEAGFNESMNTHGSYWDRMRRANLDPRISSLDNWRKATEEDPLFMLTVPWRSAGVTVHEVIHWMLLKSGASDGAKTVSDLITRILALPLRRTPEQLRFRALMKNFLEVEEE